MTYTLYQGDCLEVLPTLAAGSVDAVVTDPPYGINITKSHRLATSRGMGGKTWDSVPIGQEYLDEILRVGRHVIIWGGNYFPLPPTRCVLVWDKQNEGRDFGDFEMAWTNLDSVTRIHRQRPILMDGGKVHPTQKPVDLMRWCIRMATKPGDTVLDPFMGSGSTGVAAIMEGRRFIGIELDAQYYRIAERRIANAQPPLFVADAPAVPEPEQAAMFSQEAHP